MQTLIRPNITPGPWRLSEENNVWSDNGERVCNICLPPHETPEINARAISALPATLEALFNAYERACEDVARMELIRGPESPEVEPAYAECVSIRDEYKSALLLAGYTES